MALKPPKLSNIQGNILAGFNKDYQDFLFLRFTTPSRARAWIREIASNNCPTGLASSTSQHVLKFNTQFKALRAEGIQPEDVITSGWTHLAISFRGFKELGIPNRILARFPKAFQEGMAKRKRALGDLGANDPAKWRAPYQSGNIHALLIVAADNEVQLNNRINALINSDKFKSGVQKIGHEKGRTREDERGHEHFGFKDGVSQPGIRGVTLPMDELGNPDHGQPGQYLLWPGEFVLGYPTQKSRPKHGLEGPNPDPGPLSKSGPRRWTADGSYLVFRRLSQDVPGFRRLINALASAQGLSEDVMAAKLMGRYKSGYPLMQREFHRDSTVPPGADPGKIFPQLNDSHVLNNNFKFSDDPTGSTCPFASHIRKANPRDAIDVSAVQTHRLLRRGIPFGASFGAPNGGKVEDERGLLFVCYQKDIEEQFEWVQSKWINDPDFPPSPESREKAGPDPIAAVTHRGTFNLAPRKPNIYIQHFVRVTGGEYFFAPSLDALRKIGANQI
jgi:Dyp-type peroxidase family